MMNVLNAFLTDIENDECAECILTDIVNDECAEWM